MEKKKGLTRRAPNKILNFGEDFDFFEAEMHEKVKKFENMPSLKDSVIIPTIQEMEVMRSTVAYMREFIHTYGGHPLALEAEDVFLLSKAAHEVFGTEKGSDNVLVLGKWLPEIQKVCIFGNVEIFDKNMLKFFSTLSHELIHAHSFHSVEHTADSDGETRIPLVRTQNEETGQYGGLRSRRLGMGILNREGGYYLRDWNEAMTEELNIRFEDAYASRIPFVKEDREFKTFVFKKLAEKKGKTPEQVSREVLFVTKKEIDGQIEVSIHQRPYALERKKLRTLVGDLYKENRDTFSSKEDVFTMFAQAHLRGDLLPLARLIDTTYGKGSFRLLGEATKDSL